MNVFYLGPCSYEQPETSMPTKKYKKRQKIAEEKQKSVHKLTAKEMFEKLHYQETITIDGNYIYRRYCGTKYVVDIRFIVASKYIEMSFGGRYFGALTNQEFDAIEQKRKELGWLEE